MTTPKVYIAVPTVTGKVFFELSLRLTHWDKQSYATVVYHPFLSPIDHARNTIVRDFLLTDYTHLMMVDDDTVPPIETLDRFLFHDKDIVAAMTQLIGPNKKTGKLETTTNAYNLNEDDQYKPVDLAGLQKVDAVGTGCIMIKRQVLETLRVPPFTTEYNVDGIKYRGEDLNFCYQSNLIGIDTYVDFDLKCKHMKLCNLLALN